MATTAERLKEAMALRGCKQAELVEKTGINKGALSCYISGKYKPKQNNVYLLAKALDVSEAWLMGADVPKERQQRHASAVFDWQDYDDFVGEQKTEEQWRYEDFMMRMKRYYEKLNEYGQEHLLQTAQDMLQVDRFKKDK